MTDDLQPAHSQLPTQGEPSGEATGAIGQLDAATQPFERAGDNHAGGATNGVPGYEVLGTLGRGGMGVVYKARQIRADRTVALKMILAGRSAADEELERFRAESLAAAALNHPGIVPIYEVGEYAGQPFFSMGFVEGPTLAARLAEGPLAPRDAAEIVRQVAEAVAYAHAQGVVHRDLKPGNVLLAQAEGWRPEVGGRNQKGEAARDCSSSSLQPPVSSLTPRITDFGLAKRLGVEAASRTVTGQVLGTPSFMPPEQAEGRVDEVGPRADVYALGAMLYACLVGRPPFQAGSVMETLRQVVEQEPIRPRELDAGIPLDLETITLKCLEKDPARRYDSARDVADELRRYVAGEPIMARPIGRLARAWRWCKRKPAVASAAAVALVATVATIIVLAVSVTLVKHSEQRAVQFGEKNARLANSEQLANEQTQAAARDVEKKNIELRRQLRVSQSTRLTSESKSIATDFPVRSLLLAREAVLATAEVEYPVRAAAETALRDALGRLPGWAVFNDRFHMTMSPDGRWLAVASDGGAIRLCDLTKASRQPDFRALRGHEKEIYALRFTADSQHLVTVSIDKTARIWALSAEDPEASCRVLRGHASTVTCLSLSADGRWLATGSNDGTARIWDLAAPDPSTAVRVLRKQLGKVRNVTLSGDARWLATEGRDGVSRLWDLSATDPEATAKVLGQTSGSSVHVADADGRWLVTGISAGSAAKDECLLLFDLRAADPIATRRALTGHEMNHLVLSMAVTPNGRWLVTGGFDATARVWDLDAADPVATARVLHGHTAQINCVAISPAGRFVATGGLDRTARLYDLTAPDQNLTAQVFRGHDADVREIALGPDGQRLITSGGDLLLRAWGPGVRGPLGATPLALPGSEVRMDGPRFSPDGRWLITSEDGSVLCRDLTASDPSRIVGMLRGRTGSFSPFSVLPDGSGLATGNQDGKLRLWDLTKPGPVPAVRTFGGDGAQINGVTVTSDGRWAITYIHANRSIKVWDLKSADPASSARVLSDGEASPTLAISPDGRWLATVSGLTTKLWDLQAAGPLVAVREFTGHTDTIFGVAIDGKNRWLASGSLDKTVRLWDLQAGATSVPRILKGQKSSIWGLTISPDGRWLISEGDTTAVAWDLREKNPDEAPRVLRGHTERVRGLAISSDGRWLVTGSKDKTVRVWDLRAAEPGATSRVLRGPQVGVRTVAVSPDGKWIAAADSSGVVWLWPLEVERLLDLLPQVAGRKLTTDERAEYQLDLPALAGDDDLTETAQTAVATGQPTIATDNVISGGAATAPKSDWHVPIDRDEDVRIWVRLNKGTSARNAEAQDYLDTVQLNGATIGDDDLERLAGLTRLRQLTLFGTPITDAGLSHLCDLPNLELLFLGNTQVSGPGLAGLARLPKLGGLGIGGPLIDDDSLKHLPDLPELYWLVLSDAVVTDAGLVHLEKYPRLQILNLSGCRITDASIERIAGLGEIGLRELKLERTAVTSAGLEKLRMMLPNCQIVGPR